MKRTVLIPTLTARELEIAKAIDQNGEWPQDATPAERRNLLSLGVVTIAKMNPSEGGPGWVLFDLGMEAVAKADPGWKSVLSEPWHRAWATQWAKRHPLRPAALGGKEGGGR